MKCKYFKTRKKDNKRERRIYNYCTLLKEEIIYSQCRECVNKECDLPDVGKMKKLEQKSPLRKRTSKQNKKEKNRFSIIYQDLNKCSKCGTEHFVELNEVFEGAYRQTSIRLGMVAPFCHKHHQLFHNDRLFNLKYKALFQREYEKMHSHNEFMGIFKQDYIYLYEKETSL